MIEVRARKTHTRPRKTGDLYHGEAVESAS
jgi:hypothetical protein